MTDIEQALADLTLQVAKQAAQLSESTYDESNSARVSHCTLSKADEESLVALWNSEDFSKTRVEAMRKTARVAPEVPDVKAQERLLAIDTTSMAIEQEMPPWCRDVCRLRDHFQGCALVFTEDGEMTAYAFLFAFKRPFAAAFMQLTPVNEASPLVASNPQGAIDE